MSSSSFECGWCCEVSQYEVSIGSWNMDVFNASVSFVLLLMMVFIVIKLHASYMRLQVMSRSSETMSRRQWNSMNSNVHIDVKSTLQQQVEEEQSREQGMVRPMYYGYSLVACLWFLLQAIALLLPPTDAASALNHILYEGHAFLDNAVVIFAFFRKPSQKAVVVSITLALLVAFVKGAFTLVVTFSMKCPVCSLFFPAPQAFYPYVLLAMAYFVIIMLMFTPRNFPLRPRKTVFFWCLFLMIFYSIASIGAALYYFADEDSGFCLINFTVVLYALVYAPLMYYTFVLDSKQLRMEKHARQVAEASSADPGSALTMAKMLLRKYPGIPWIDIADIRKGPRIGIGASAEVYSGLWQGTPVAVKRLYADRSQSLEDFFREITVMSNLSHPNIVLLMGVYVDALGDRFIITEYMEKGSVYDVLHPPTRPVGSAPRPDPPNVALSPKIHHSASSHAISRIAASSPSPSHLSGSSSAPVMTQIDDRKGSEVAEHSLFVSEDYEDSHSTQLTPERALVVLQHAARAMAYLHSFEPPILHRDLKTHNLLVGDGWVVKIADFGLSRAVSAQTMTAAGTPQWSAPEVIRQDRYTEKADVFSFGIVVFELLTARIPYQNMPAMTAAHAVAYEGLRPSFPRGLSKQYVDLAKLCWSEQPDDRPSFEELVSLLDTLPPPELPYLDEYGNIRPMKRG